MGKIIVGILIILFCIAGCSDMPYTGSLQPVHEVDRYLVSTDGNAVCFEDNLDATCIKLTPKTANGTEDTNGPAIYIYPEERVYLFYHEGSPILRAERRNPQTTDPTANPPTQDPSTPNGDNGNNGNNDGDGNNGNNDGDGNNGNNGNNGGSPNDDNPGGNGTDPTADPPAGGPSTPNGQDTDNDNAPTDPTTAPPQGGPSTPNGQDTDNDNADDGHGWIIWVYYPDNTIPQDSPTLSESGVTVTINGKRLTDADITGFAQFIGPNGETGIQFFYPTQSAELLDLKIRMEGVVAEDDPVKFNINYLWNSQ